MSQGLASVRAAELVLGRYRPLRPLGRGGSGSVWLARDEQTGLDVALKIVPREGKAAARAEREAEAASRLRHPGCLRAYAFGHDGGHAYIAYEFAPGRTLRDAIRAGELDDAAAVEAAAQILDALAHAHAQGIVHRDVKPANILLVDGPALSARLLDFGLAQMDEADTLTAVGDVPGTLAYISPERLAGDVAGPPSDVWAVGVLLWEALAGWHPFWRASLLETGEAISAGAEPLAHARPDLPETLTAAVDRALALDVARRPSAARLADALRAGKRQRDRRGAARPTRVVLPTGRVLTIGAAALVAGWTTAVMPFYPEHFPLGFAAVAGAAAFARERLGIAVALAAPILPLGNVSLALALVYAAAAIAWLALSWRDPRSALAFTVGPLLAPVAALGLLPLALHRIGSPLRRAAQAGAGVLVAAAVASRPEALGVAGSERPLEVLAALVEAVPRELAVEAAALALVAAVLPFAATRGLWWIAGLGALMLAATLLPAPGLAAAPLVVAAWVTCAALARKAER